MDYSTAEGMRKAKRARVLTPWAADDVDLISGLDDDVLLRVLGLVADVRDAARTAAVSRRWLRLWTRVPALRFASRPVSTTASAAERCAALEQYVSFVNDILARRTQSDCSIESLAISYATELMPVSVGADSDHNLKKLLLLPVSAAQEWIRYAFQHGIKSLDLDMQLPARRRRIGRERRRIDRGKGKKKPPVVLLDGLPSPLSLETMRLALGGARLRLPTTVEFTSLKDLSLERIKIADDGGAHLLARLVSAPSYPHLRKLRMRQLWFPDLTQQMRLEADVLSELWVEDVYMMSLELRTPSLRFLHVDRCCYAVLSLSAPGLEEVALLGRPPPRLLQVDGDLPRVLSLKVSLWSHRPRYGDCVEQNDSSMLLLKHCGSVACLQVTLDGPKVFKEDVDLMKGKVPHLPQITSLTVNVSDNFERHDYGAGMACLLTRFTNLRHLRLHLPFFASADYDLGEGLGLECDHPDHWTSNEISMAHLQEVEFTGLTGTNCELWFMKAVLGSAKRLCKVAISFNPKCWQHEGIMDAFHRMLLDEGMWNSRRDTHMLTCQK